jgi:hypothetical protein
VLKAGDLRYKPDWCNLILKQQFEFRGHCYTSHIKLWLEDLKEDIKLYLVMVWFKLRLKSYCLLEFFILSMSTCVQCLPVYKAISHPSCGISFTVSSEVEGIIVSVAQIRQGAQRLSGSPKVTELMEGKGEAQSHIWLQGHFCFWDTFLPLQAGLTCPRAHLHITVITTS